MVNATAQKEAGDIMFEQTKMIFTGVRRIGISTASGQVSPSRSQYYRQRIWLHNLSQIDWNTRIRTISSFNYFLNQP
jgi:hypothetical protein